MTTGLQHFKGTDTSLTSWSSAGRHQAPATSCCCVCVHCAVCTCTFQRVLADLIPPFIPGALRVRRLRARSRSDLCSRAAALRRLTTRQPVRGNFTSLQLVAALARLSVCSPYQSADACLSCFAKRCIVGDCIDFHFDHNSTTTSRVFWTGYFL